jgi:hypothetical protein
MSSGAKRKWMFRCLEEMHRDEDTLVQERDNAFEECSKAYEKRREAMWERDEALRARDEALALSVRTVSTMNEAKDKIISGLKEEHGKFVGQINAELVEAQQMIKRLRGDAEILLAQNFALKKREEEQNFVNMRVSAKILADTARIQELEEQLRSAGAVQALLQFK